MAAAAATLPPNYVASEQLKLITEDQIVFPRPIPGWTDDPELQLRRFQERGAAWLFLAMRGILADQVGLGKSIQVIALVSLLKASGLPHRTVVVTLPGRMPSQWRDEFNRFSPGLNVTMVTSANHRARRAHEYAGWWDVLIVPYSILLRDVEFLEAQEFDVCVFDESSTLRNHEIATRVAAQRLVRGRQRRVLLDATPVQLTLADMHSQLDLLGLSIFGPLEAFQDRYLIFESSLRTTPGRGRKSKRVVGYRNFEEFVERILPYILRRRRDDPDVALELPQVTVETQYLALSQAEMDVYNDAREGFLRVYEGGVTHMLQSSWHTVRQVCSSTAVANPANPRSSKVEWLQRALRDGMLATEPGRPPEKVLVYATYHSVITHIQRGLADIGIVSVPYHGHMTEAEKAEAVARFRDDPACRVMVATSSVERGLNLQHASVLVTFDQITNPQRTVQLVGRLQRIGSVANRILCVNLVAEDTMEERLADLIARRAAVSDALFEEDTDLFRTLTPEEMRSLFR